MITAPLNQLNQLLKDVIACPKCGREKMHRHEDGLQCWYCDFILYRDKPLPLKNPYHRQKANPNLW